MCLDVSRFWCVLQWSYSLTTGTWLQPGGVGINSAPARRGELCFCPFSLTKFALPTINASVVAVSVCFCVSVCVRVFVLSQAHWAGHLFH